ncbi:MAG: histidine phosphatase family protein [Leptospiraceae bacterium]|nr:histidine phosphatase family protein [Leptospiraceae bacterium]
MAIDILLIRHGQTRFNAEHRIQGSLDSELTELGQEQSIAAGRALFASSRIPDYWWVSPQGRARQTSALIRSQANGQKLPGESVHADLQEIDCGEFEGRIFHELDPERVAWHKAHPEAPWPGGESILDVLQRTTRFLADLVSAAVDARKQHRAVVVAHGNTLRCLSAVFLQLGLPFVIRTQLDNCSISRFQAADVDAEFRMLYFNQTRHTIAELW